MVREVGIMIENVTVELFLKFTRWFELFVIFDEMAADVAWVDDAFARDADENVVEGVDYEPMCRE